MKRLIIALAWFALGARVTHAEWQLGFEKQLAELDGGAVFVEREATQGGRAARVQGVFFSEKSLTFRVVDNPVPGKGGLAAAMQSGGFIAGVNGGYFHGDWTPVGLEISGGTTVHRFERAKLLSGVLSIRASGIQLLRSADYKPARDERDALQAGPFLVDAGRATPGLNGLKLARRTVVATNGRGGWAILLFSPVSLADAAAILSSPAIFKSWPVQRALNLDGGSSSALWVATSPKPFYLSEFGSVRNYLAIGPR